MPKEQKRHKLDQDPRMTAAINETALEPVAKELALRSGEFIAECLAEKQTADSSLKVIDRILQKARKRFRTRPMRHFVTHPAFSNITNSGNLVDRNDIRDAAFETFTRAVHMASQPHPDPELQEAQAEVHVQTSQDYIISHMTQAPINTYWRVTLADRAETWAFMYFMDRAFLVLGKRLGENQVVSDLQAITGYVKKTVIQERPPLYKKQPNSPISPSSS